MCRRGFCLYRRSRERARGCRLSDRRLKVQRLGPVGELGVYRLRVRLRRNVKVWRSAKANHLASAHVGRTRRGERPARIELRLASREILRGLELHWRRRNVAGQAPIPNARQNVVHQRVFSLSRAAGLEALARLLLLRRAKANSSRDRRKQRQALLDVLSHLWRDGEGGEVNRLIGAMRRNAHFPKLRVGIILLCERLKLRRNDLVVIAGHTL